MSMEGRKKGFWLLRTFCTISAGVWPTVSTRLPWWGRTSTHVLSILTFRAQIHALNVEGAIAQSNLLHNDAKAVDISFLHAWGGQVPLLQQLWGCPQLLWWDRAMEQ